MTRTERRELRDDLKSEIEELDADLIGYLEELKDVRSRIAEAKRLRAELVGRRATLKVVAK